MFWAPHALIWTSFVFYSASTLLTTFQCSPIAKAWDPLIIGGHCHDTRAISTIVAIFNCITDFLILVLPLRAIWKLQLSRQKKLVLSSVFLVGVMYVKV